MKIILRCFMLVISMSVYSFSPKIETFNVTNYSKKTYTINVELAGGIGILEKSYFVRSEVNGMELMIKDRLTLLEKNKINPGESLEIVYYISDNYEEMKRIPFMDKIRGIFKSIEIISDDHSSKITLEDLDYLIIKKLVLFGETAYFLEIFDYEMIGKPGSEW